MSPVSHDAVVRPKERAAAILAQVDREMARIKERDHHWEDGMEVSCFCSATLFFNSPSSRMHINLSLFLNLNDISSGSFHQRRPDHHLHDPAQATPLFRSGVPSECVVGAEARYM
jgi:hypothetical protein